MKVEITVPDGTSGNWSVESFSVEENDLSQMISIFKSGRGVPQGNYKRLMRNKILVMSNTPDEISDFLYFYGHAKGKILINGLGLGVTVKALLNKPKVTQIIVIEKSEDVIKLCGPTYQNDDRVTIIHGDAFDYKPPKNERYDAVWHDIWDNITSDNLPEMIKLHRKYGRRTTYQESWCRYECEQQRNEDKKYNYHY